MNVRVILTTYCIKSEKVNFMNWLLIKVALIVAISQIPLETKALEENYESNFIQNESEEIVGNLPKANVILYCYPKRWIFKKIST